jgi:hypothetical protein
VAGGRVAHREAAAPAALERPQGAGERQQEQRGEVQRG